MCSHAQETSLLLQELSLSDINPHYLQTSLQQSDHEPKLAPPTMMCNAVVCFTSAQFHQLLCMLELMSAVDFSSGVCGWRMVAVMAFSCLVLISFLVSVAHAQGIKSALACQVYVIISS